MVRLVGGGESGENVLVVVALVDASDGDPLEVLLLRRHDVRWDEEAYLAALASPLDDDDRFTLTLTRTRSVWEGPPRHDVQVSLRLAVGRDGDAPAPARRKAQAILRRLLEDAPSAGVGRDEAIERARAAVAAGWGRSDTGDLAVSEEEHRPSKGTWVLGLSEPAGARYRAEVGAVDGNPSTVHVVRTEVPEVSDSIGT